MAIIAVRRHPNLWTRVHAGIIGLGVIVMPTIMLFTTRPRSPAGLGASFQGFCRIVAFQVFVPVFRGLHNSAQLAQHPVLLSFVSCAITAAGLAVLTYVVLRGSMNVRSQSCSLRSCSPPLWRIHQQAPLRPNGLPCEGKDPPTAIG